MKEILPLRDEDRERERTSESLRLSLNSRERLVCESVSTVSSDVQHLPEGIPLHFFALQGSNLLMHMA